MHSFYKFPGLSCAIFIQLSGPSSTPFELGWRDPLDGARFARPEAVFIQRNGSLFYLKEVPVSPRGSSRLPPIVMVDGGSVRRPTSRTSDLSGQVHSPKRGEEAP